METIELLKLAADAGTSILLMVIMWQGLKRFDLLLNLVITLAARSKLSTDEIEEIRSQVFKNNGNAK